MVFDAPMVARLRDRFDKLNDSCVNGFLFLENMDDSYIGLTGMPEIFSDIMAVLNRRDIQEEYYKQKTCYVAVISAKIEELIFDGIDPSISDQEKTQKNKPQSVRRVEIPKPDGGVRNLGVPTVIDRFVQQVVAQVLTPIFEEQFRGHSYGCRPNRCAQQAVLKALEMMNDGHNWVVDIDL